MTRRSALAYPREVPAPQPPLWLELVALALGVPALMFLVGLLLYVLDVANPPGW